MNLTYFWHSVKLFCGYSRILGSMNTRTEQDYLKALFSLSEKSGQSTVAGLSERLGVTKPTVTSMVKKLARKKLVQHARYKPMRLTEKGRREALLVIRKHRLVEMFLVTKLNFGWEEVHDLAEQFEHVEAPEFFERLDVILNFPTLDPHGEPIPDKTGNLDLTAYQPLSSCKTGDRVRLRALADSSGNFLRFLNNRGLRLGLRVSVETIEPFEGSMVVSYGKRRFETLPHTVCENLLVEKP